MVFGLWSCPKENVSHSSSQSSLWTSMVAENHHESHISTVPEHYYHRETMIMIEVLLVHTGRKQIQHKHVPSLYPHPLYHHPPHQPHPPYSAFPPSITITITKWNPSHPHMFHRHPQILPALPHQNTHPNSYMQGKRKRRSYKA